VVFYWVLALCFSKKQKQELPDHPEKHWIGKCWHGKAKDLPHK